MPKIRIATLHPLLGHRLAVTLRARGFEVDVAVVERVPQYQLTHAPSVGSEALVELLEALDPFAPPTASGAVDGADVELSLGEPARLSSVRVRVLAEGDGLAARACEELSRLGLGSVEASAGVVTAATLRHGDGALFTRHLVRWWSKGLGVPVRESVGPMDGESLELRIADPSVARRPLRERARVSLRCDDDATRALVEDALRARGLLVDAGGLAASDHEARFTLQLGPLSNESELDASGMVRAVREALARAAIDAASWPLLEERDEDEDAAIVLPVARCRAGALRPYDGDAPARFEVVVRTDDVARAAPLREALLAAGFADVRLAPTAREAFGWSVHYGKLRRDAAAAQAIASVVREARAADPALAALPLFESDAGRHLARRMRAMPDDTIQVDAPFTPPTPEQIEAKRRAELGRVRVLLAHPPGLDPAPFVARLRALGVRQVRPNEDADLEPLVQIGGAHPLAVEALAALVAHGFGEPLRVERVWDDRDLDVGLPLAALAEADRGVTTERKAPRRRGGRATPARALIEETPTRLRIADVWLDKRDADHPLVPARALGEQLALDDETAATLVHLARAVRLREPCLLEGETSTSKTSSVLWLAARLGVPIARINLHGHTDAAELVGRHLPSAQGGWAWHDGLLLRAMLEGMWVILDEVNLAEPSVVERVDPLLERTPTLVLTEHDHRVYAASASAGAGVSKIHDDFRVFATMNPVAYAGRARLSPAFLDRFRAHRFVQPPSEEAFAAMLRLLVHGTQPDVVLGGRPFAGGRIDAPPFAQLAAVPGVEAALARVARFHTGVSEALRAEAGLSSIALPTRRALLSVLDALTMMLGDGVPLGEAVADALARYYVERLPRGAEREAVQRLLEAHGLDGAGAEAAE
jgi:midasin